MKLKWTGEQESITIRGVTFEKGKPVDVEDEATALKCAAIDGFVKAPGRKAKTDGQDGA